MTEEQREPEKGFEEQVRELMAEDAYTIRPSPVPYPTIRRRGALERRRRVVAAAAVLVALAAAPVGAYALNGDGGGGSDTAAPQPSASTSQGTTPTPVQPQSVGPAGPATPGQLLDGITLAQASDGLEKCLAYDRENQKHRTPEMRSDLGDAADYRIILAQTSTGDSNAPGDGIYVVAVKEQPRQPQLIRLICNIKDGKASGLNSSVGGTEFDNGGPVMADDNGGKLYRQSVLDNGNWKMPFRWSTIGRFEPSVTKVTVSYGGSTSEAVLDHGWFVASGVLNQQVTLAPHVKGYDSAGEVVYDSDDDKGYTRELY